MDLPTYTNIWRIEKRLYKLYDFRLPMPLPVGQIAIFLLIAVPYVLVLTLLGLPFSHTLLWVYVLPPGVLAWLTTRPVLEGKRLPELVLSQLRYLLEPRTWCRMAPLAEKDEISVTCRVWRRAEPREDVAPATVRQTAVFGRQRRATRPLALNRRAAHRGIAASSTAASSTAASSSTPEPAMAAGAAAAEAVPVRAARKPVPAHAEASRADTRRPGARARALTRGGGGMRATEQAAPLRELPRRSVRGAARQLPLALSVPGQAAPSEPPPNEQLPSQFVPTQATWAPGSPTQAVPGQAAPSEAAQAASATATPAQATPVQLPPAQPTAAQVPPAAAVPAGPASATAPPPRPASAPPAPAIAAPAIAAQSDAARSSAARADAAWADAARAADAARSDAARADAAQSDAARADAAQSDAARADTERADEAPLPEAPGQPDAPPIVPVPGAPIPRPGLPVTPQPDDEIESPLTFGPPVARPYIAVRPSAARRQPSAAARLADPAPVAAATAAPAPAAATAAAVAEPVAPAEQAAGNETEPARGAVESGQQEIAAASSGVAPVAGDEDSDQQQESGAAVPDPDVPPRPARPTVTVTGDLSTERPLRVVERALRSPGQRSDGWRDRVVVVPGGHRPGKPDQLQRDRARARLPVDGARRIVVLGCTRGAGQTMVTLLAGDTLARLRAESVAVLDLNPGRGSLTERAATIPGLVSAAIPGQPGGPDTGLQVITGNTGWAATDDAGRILDSVAGRYPLTFADPAAACVPRALQVADQLLIVAPASADAVNALGMTFEWLEANGHGRLATSAITVLNGVSGSTQSHVDHAATVAAGRCRAIVKVPWDGHLHSLAKERSPERSDGGTDASAPVLAAPTFPAASPLSTPLVAAYTALAGVLIAGLADPDELRSARA